VACQFHPEFKSRPQKPHPLFQSFIRAALTLRLEKQPKPQVAASESTHVAQA
jgi:CTP synthase